MTLRDLFWDSPGKSHASVSRAVRITNLLIVFLCVSLLFTFAFGKLAYHWNWASALKYWYKFAQGWLVTVGVSSAALIASLVMGVLVALGRRAAFLPLRYFCAVYTEAIRGTPLLVQILIFFYVVADAFGMQNRYVVGVLILSVFSAAYISEIVRGGIESVGGSQIESAKAVGFTRAQTYRYVIFPQATRRILPALAGQFVSLIKDSSLLSIISINEFTLNAQEVNAYTFSALESYIPLAVGYLILTLPISFWSRSLERKFHYET